jgi:two-component system, sensor histidine kinase PdtaS
VPSLNDVARAHTDLAPDDLDWLHALVADWQLLADLSFADLVLWLPDRDGSGYHVGAQMRPTTGPTAHPDDLVGSFAAAGSRPLLGVARGERRIVREGEPDWRAGVPVRTEAIPVLRAGRVLAVIGRDTNLVTVRTPSRLELTYLQCAGELATMIAEGSFPACGRSATVESRGGPRVGDGLVRLDPDGVVVFASPNALSAYRRLGLSADLMGAHLGRTTAMLAAESAPVEESLAVRVGGQHGRESEIETAGATVDLRVIPLLPGGVHVGAIVLVHDVTELRRRERELVSKDATIREVHHRVKNSLQTVAALLRLQSRRLEGDAARSALDEAVRRIGSIALVHETLSAAGQSRVGFDEVADRVLALAQDMVVSPGARIARIGSFGPLPEQVATPLALVLAELVHNALEHGLAGHPGSIDVEVRRRPGQRLEVTVRDDGTGLPAGFDPAFSSGLGLQIARTLVEHELRGPLVLSRRAGGGTEATISVVVPAEGSPGG